VKDVASTQSLCCEVVAIRFRGSFMSDGKLAIGGSLRKDGAAVGELPVRVMRHVPRATIGVAEIARVAAPERLLRRLEDF
jgi:hypothetical protein